MKKCLSLLLALSMVFALAVPALADEPDTSFGGFAGDEGFGFPGAEDATIPEQFVGTITVDGVDVDLTGIPGAPAGYIPMRVVCEAAGAYVDWYAEDNEAFFEVGGLGVVVNLGDLSITCDFEPVEDFTAYLDPAGYTFLPVAFLNGRGDFRVDDHPEMDAIRYDITTVPDRSPLGTLAYEIVEAAEIGSTIELDEEMRAGFGIREDNFAELWALYPAMSANPSMVFVGEVVMDQMEAAKEDFQAVLDNLMASMGNYPSSAELIEMGQIVESPDGRHLMVIVSGANDAGIALFLAAFPARGR